MGDSRSSIGPNSGTLLGLSMTPSVQVSIIFPLLSWSLGVDLFVFKKIGVKPSHWIMGLKDLKMPCCAFANRWELLFGNACWSLVHHSTHIGASAHEGKCVLYQLSLFVIDELFSFHDEEVVARISSSTQWVVHFLQKGDDMGKFRSMDDIVSVDGFPGYACLLPFLSAYLDILCEVRGGLRNLVYFVDEVLICLRLNIYKMTIVLIP